MNDYLCKDLRLSIRRLEGEVELSLRDEVLYEGFEPNAEVKLCYRILEEKGGKNRRYHLREAIVIGMRRLMGLAIEANLISDFPGESTTSNTGITPEAGLVPPGLSITFVIDEEL